MVENQPSNKNVLIVVADGVARERLMLAYGEAGFEVRTALDMKTARPRIHEPYELVIADAQLPDGEAVELLARAVHTPVYFRCDDLDERLRLSSAGAAGFVVDEGPLPQVYVARPELGEDLGLTGSSEAVQALRQRIKQVAASDGRVLVVGPTGSGKSVVVEALRALSQRRQGPLVTVNAAAVPEALIESELFGHRAGAFTDATTDRQGRFVEADGGILVLDQVGDLPLPQQARLLRVLETGMVTPVGGKAQRVDVRVFATAHESLDVLVEQKRMRADLYHRLMVHVVPVPSLHERREDVADLVRHFAPSFVEVPGFVARLEREAWPGNVRQLAHFLERIHLLRRAGEPLLELVDHELTRRPGVNRVGGAWLGLPLAELVHERVAASLPEDQEVPEGLYHEVLAEVERGLFRLVLDRVGGKQLPAARLLGLNRNTLHKKLKKLGMLKS
jgi:two-component system nitrogen regulation response regulator GlnG